MRRVVAVLSFALVLGLLAPTSVHAGLICTGDVTVDMADNAYSPTTVTRSWNAGFTGFDVCWSNTGSNTHTATSIDGFFDTGDVAGGAEVGDAIPGTGAFAYRCLYHPIQMQGTLRLRPLASDTSVTAGQEVTLAIGDSATKGYNWDVQRKRGNGEWVTIKRRVGANVVVRPSRAGTFRYRARTRDFGTDEVSGWSPPRRVIVSAA